MSFAVHTFETNPQEEKKNHAFSFRESLEEGQDVFFLAQIDPSGTDPQKAAEILFGTLMDHLETASGNNGYDRFEEALRIVNLEARKNRNLFGKTPHIVIAYFDFQNLYITQTGSSEAYLIRGANVSQISEFSEEGEDLFLNILSGQIAVKDTILLSSTRILRSVTASQLSEMFTRGDFSDSVSLLRHELSTHSEENLVITAIGVGKNDKQAGGAGFLSKVVSKGKAAVEAAKATKETSAKEETTSFHEELETPEPQESFATKVPEIPVAPKAPSRDLSSLVTALPKPPKNLIIIAAAVLVVLISGLGLRSMLGQQSEESLVLEEKLAVARTALQQADAYLLQGEKPAARESLSTATTALQVVLNSEDKERRSQAMFTMAQIEDIRDQIENVTKLTPDVIANIGAKNATFKAQGVLGINGNVYAYDNRNLHKTVRNIVEQEVLISEKETIIAGAARPEQDTLVFLTDGPRIVEYKDGVINPMATEDAAWKRGIDVKNFSSRFTYILDPVENQIWKYTRQRANYSAGSPYSNGADLSQAVSMVIDGAIYVLSEDGTITKLFRGDEVEYDFRNVPEVPFQGKGLRIYTTAELAFLYVLDPANSRVLIFEKGERFATYKRQVEYNVPDEKVVDLLIDAAGQKATLMTETKIYEVTL